MSSFYQLNPPPKYGLIGHRGVAGLRPENTLASFQHAAELGLNWIEFDVQLTSCGVWVVFHDEVVTIRSSPDQVGKFAKLNTKKTSTHLEAASSYKITELSLAALRQLDVASWFDPNYSQEKIPTLAEVLNLADSLGLQTNIEIKIFPGIDPQYYAETLASFLSTRPKSSATALPLVSCFDLNCLQYLRKLLPTLPLGYLVNDFTADPCKIAVDNALNTINCDVNHITQQNIAAANADNLPVLLYTINDPELAKYWLDSGVAAVFTDRPDQLLPR